MKKQRGAKRPTVTVNELAAEMLKKEINTAINKIKFAKTLPPGIYGKIKKEDLPPEKSDNQTN